MGFVGLSPGEMWFTQPSTAPVEVQSRRGSQTGKYCVVLANPWNPDRGLGFPYNYHAMSASTAYTMAERLRQRLNIADAFEFIDETTYYHLASDLALRQKLVAEGSKDDLTLEAGLGSRSSTCLPPGALQNDAVASSTGTSSGDDADTVPSTRDAPTLASAWTSLPTPSTSSTSSPNAPANPALCAAPVAQQDELTPNGCAPRHDSADNECPICMDTISANAAVRCLSEPCHYFHNECLGRWISESPNGVPSCPMCRQGIKIDAQVLADYLRDSNVTAADRSRLQYLLDNRLDRWVVLRSAAQDVRLMVDVPLNMYRGVINGFHNLTEQQNMRLDEGLGVMRAVMRLASEQFQDDDREISTHPCLPHTYAIKYLRRSRRGLLEWTRTRLRQTESEIERARRINEDRDRV